MVAVATIGGRPDAASADRVSWALGVAPLVDAVWLVGPADGTFPAEAAAALEGLGDMARSIGIAVATPDGEGAQALRRPVGRPQSDFRAMLRNALARAR
jgi:hypothetical protein